jgi:hypothetical protein
MLGVGANGWMERRRGNPFPRPVELILRTSKTEKLEVAQLLSQGKRNLGRTLRGRLHPPTPLKICLCADRLDPRNETRNSIEG